MNTLDARDYQLTDLAEVHRILDEAGAPQYGQASSRLLALLASREVA